MNPLQRVSGIFRHRFQSVATSGNSFPQIYPA
jgi:hypothetical protein